MEALIKTRDAELSQHRLRAVAEIGVAALIAAGVMAAFGSWSGWDPSRQAIAVPVFEALVITFIWWSQRRRGLTLADLGLTFSVPGLRTVGRTVAWSLAVAIGSAALSIASVMTMSLIAGQLQAADMSMYDDLRGDPWAIVGMIAAVWVTSSFAEEVIYRGFLIRRLEEAFAGVPRATLIAVVVGGLVFGAIHYAWGPVGMLLTAVMGIALGTAYVTLGRRLWIVILAHAYMDTALFVQVYLMGATGG